MGQGSYLLQGQVGNYGKNRFADSHNRTYVHKCEWCGKFFDTYPVVTEWCYKIREQNKKSNYEPIIHWFCSWNCQVGYEKTKDIKYRVQHKNLQGKQWKKGLSN